MTLQEIKSAVSDGKIVCWKSSAYIVKKYKLDYMIVCTINGHTIGLTWTDGVTMNGKDEDFYIQD